MTDEKWKEMAEAWLEGWRGSDSLASLLARVDAEAVERGAREERKRFHDRFIDWRGIEVGCACEKCGGSGIRVYANTSTWRGGIGGQAITSDVCDKCWGSGDKHKSWTDLRTIRATLGAREGTKR